MISSTCAMAVLFVFDKACCAVIRSSTRSFRIYDLYISIPALLFFCKLLAPRKALLRFACSLFVPFHVYRNVTYHNVTQRNVTYDICLYVSVWIDMRHKTRMYMYLTLRGRPSHQAEGGSDGRRQPVRGDDHAGVLGADSGGVVDRGAEGRGRLERGADRGAQPAQPP